MHGLAIVYLPNVIGICHLQMKNIVPNKIHEYNVTGVIMVINKCIQKHHLGSWTKPKYIL